MSHSLILLREISHRLKKMGLVGQIAPSEVLILMQQKALTMDEAMRLLSNQRTGTP